MASGLFTLKQQVQALRQGAWNGQRPTAVEYLVVAGGGAGGANGGGGGAGGLLSGITPVSTGSAITVTVGAGGSGQTYANRSAITGGFNSVFGNITTTGGGQGGTESYSWGAGNGAGGNGGSGGGGGFFAATVSGGQSVSGQGNAGGTNAGVNLNPYGGGGGAGAAGLNAIQTDIGGNGGAGVASSISGTVTAYAGGGGGKAPTTDGIGGAGGGGAAGTTGTNGTANTGGGGGGTGGGTSGNGGSGIVILSYPDTYAAATSSTGSPTVSTSGSGSIAFNGSNTALSNTTGYAANQFGTGNFTIEFWQYYTAFSTYQTVISQGYQSSTGLGFLLQTSASNAGTLVFYSMNSGTTTTVVAESGTVNLNTWYHVAIVRNGATTTFYRNGVSVGSATDTTNYANTGTFVIGGGSNTGVNNFWFSGYLSNLRIVKGSAIYTSSFTPSIAPLTAVTNTTVLLNSTSGSYLVDSSSSALTFTLNGTPTWNQLSPFATGLGYKNRVYTWTSSGSITF
jgi:hypothetical protein